MAIIGDAIANMKSYTNQMQAATDTVTGTASATLTSSEFMNLMLKQLEFQDPMDPQDNAEFVSQQAQFSQLQATQDMSDSIAQNNSIMQTLTLVGKEVDIIDPEDSSKTITGVVTEGKFGSKGTSIVVGGKEYPISLIKSAREASSET